MSKELADKMDVGKHKDAEKAREKLADLLNDSPLSDLSKEELDELIEKSRNGEYIPIRVQSWEELWNQY